MPEWSDPTHPTPYSEIERLRALAKVHSMPHINWELDMDKTDDPQQKLPHLAFLFVDEGVTVEVSVGEGPWACVVKLNGRAVMCTDIRFRIDPQSGKQYLELSLVRPDSRDVDEVIFSGQGWFNTILGGQLFVESVRTVQRWH